MRNANAAEWILGLVTGPARAAATIGDLLEEDGGAVRFWSSVLRTTASHVFEQLWHHPFATLRLGVDVYLEMVGLMCLLLLPVVCLISVACDIPRWAYVSLIFAVDSTAHFVAGWHIARDSKGREISAAIAPLALYGAWPPRPSHPIYAIPHWPIYLGPLIYLAGVVLCRLRAQRREHRLCGVTNA